MEIAITALVCLLVTASALPLLALFVGLNGSPRLSMSMVQETLDHFERNRRHGGGGWYGHDISPHIRSFVHPQYGKVRIHQGASVTVSRPGFAGQATYIKDMGDTVVFSPGLGVRLGLWQMRKHSLLLETAGAVLSRRWV